MYPEGNEQQLIIFKTREITQLENTKRGRIMEIF